MTPQTEMRLEIGLAQNIARRALIFLGCDDALVYLYSVYTVTNASDFRIAFSAFELQGQILVNPGSL